MKAMAGKYVVLDGDRLLGVAKTYPEGRKVALEAGVRDAFFARHLGKDPGIKI